MENVCIVSMPESNCNSFFYLDLRFRWDIWERPVEDGQKLIEFACSAAALDRQEVRMTVNRQYNDNSRSLDIFVVPYLPLILSYLLAQQSIQIGSAGPSAANGLRVRVWGLGCWECTRTRCYCMQQSFRQDNRFRNYFWTWFATSRM